MRGLQVLPPLSFLAFPASESLLPVFALMPAVACSRQPPTPCVHLCDTGVAVYVETCVHLLWDQESSGSMLTACSSVVCVHVHTRGRGPYIA